MPFLDPVNLIGVLLIGGVLWLGLTIVKLQRYVQVLEAELDRD